MFGVSSVKETQVIDLVIHLERNGQKKRPKERVGLDETYKEILDIKVPSHTIPIRPGRNLAIIVESAAVNFRQKENGI